MNGKRRLFVEHYCDVWNATEAARRAGYSPATAYSQGQRLLKDVEVVAAIEARTHELMPRGEVVQRIARIARADMTDFLSTDGGPVMLDLRKAARAHKLGLIKSFKRDNKGGVSIELHDSLAALLALLKRYDQLDARSAERDTGQPYEQPQIREVQVNITYEPVPPEQ